MTDLSLVVVTHGSSRVLGGAIRSFRSEAARLGLRAEVVVVEQSEDDGELESVATLGPDRLERRPNRGYAAGVNEGVAVAVGGTVLVGNPDIELRAGSLAPLLEGLDGGVDIVGPQFELAGFRFPPADPPSPGWELSRWASSLHPVPWRRFVTRELARYRLVWSTREGLVRVRALSGALLVFRRAVWDRVGPWDESFFMYYEESDWIRRARRRGLVAGIAVESMVEHRWGHSTDPTTEQWFERSRRRYYRKHHGWLQRIAGFHPGRYDPTGGKGWPSDLPEQPCDWLVSPHPLGLPAALCHSETAPVTAVDGFRDRLSRPRPLVVLAVGKGDGRVAGCWSLAADEERAQ